MQCFVKTQAVSLPVTALHSIKCDNITLLLVGQGPVLHIYDSATSPRTTSSRVFAVQAIHSIISRKVISGHQLIVTGGCLVALIDLVWEVDHGFLSFHLDKSFVLEASDWILKTYLLESNQCHCIGLTANNALVKIPLHDSESNHPITVLTQGTKSFLYSGDISGTETDSLVVASGSVFGEILVWSSRLDEKSLQWHSMLLKKLSGHSGSVFGVQISKVFTFNDQTYQVLASCSDDRTIRLWNIGHSNPQPSDELVSTGFGTAVTYRTDELAMAWGHLSRIWSIDFLDLPSLNTNIICMASRGEDGYVQIWSFQVRSMNRNADSPKTLLKLESDRHHSGKNVWSMTCRSDEDHHTIFSGGADGQVILRGFPTESQKLYQPLLSSARFSQIPVLKKNATLKDYVLINGNKIIATTNYGDLLSHDRYGQEPDDWKLVYSNRNHAVTRLSGNRANTIAVAISSTDIILIRDQRTDPLRLFHEFQTPVTWFQVAGEIRTGILTSTRLCLVVIFAACTAPELVWLTQDGNGLRFKSAKLALPETFIVTSTCFDSEKQVLVLGSRTGSIAIYEGLSWEEDAIEHFCLRRVHRSDTVTTILVMPEVQDLGHLSDSYWHFLTTGRDGTYAIHKVLGSSQNTSRTRKIETIHRSTPPFGPQIEGASLTIAANGCCNELILYGFDSKDFVAWNETRHQNVLSVECGGAHRSWAYFQDLTSRQGGQFVWTKAGSFNCFHQASANNTIVQCGGHGREIKALAGCIVPYSDCTCDFVKRKLVATGAEDTTIRLFSIDTDAINEFNQFHCTSILNGHTTGLQCLVFSSCGRYLFSSASMEEFSVWRLTSEVPCVGIGIVSQDKIPKEEVDSDARILSFAVQPLGEESSFLIVAAYSTGKAKIVKYTDKEIPGQGSFELVSELLFGSFCLTQALFLEDSNSQILTAGTNGYLNICRVPLNANDNMITHVHRVHQSSITSTECVRLGSKYVILTGGDDNALAISILNAPETNQAVFKSVLIPNAHAAAVTGLALLNASSAGDSCQITIATAGNDQKVKVWKICLSTKHALNVVQDDLLEFIQVQKLVELWTSVADVSNMRLIHTGNDSQSFQVMVVGVGMEILQLNIDRSFA